MNKFILIGFVSLLMAFACTKKQEQEARMESVTEEAQNMFRRPSGEEAKIKDKFQPIDHNIKQEKNE